MNKMIPYRLAIYTVFATVLFSCMSVSKYVNKRARMNSNAVAKDFNPQKHILLFAEMPRLNNPDQRNDAITNKLEKALKEYCPYKYEIVSLKDIYENNTKYGDTSIYKYAILNSLNSTWHSTRTTTTITSNTGTTRSSVSPSARSTAVDFNFYDRITQKHYPSTGNGTAFINYTMAAFMELIKRTTGK